MPDTTVYELAVLYRADLEEALDKAAAKVKALVTERGGKIVTEDVWGKRQLAYQIKKETHAIYVFYDVEIAGDALSGIEAALNINEEVLRYQFHKPDFKAREVTAARAAAKEKEAAETAAEDKPAETETAEVN